MEGGLVIPEAHLPISK
jgi:hypothetical protein